MTEEVICKYTLEDAVKDGVLFDVRFAWKYCVNLVSHISIELSQYYITEQNIPNLIDLNNQVYNKYIKLPRESKDGSDDQYFFAVNIEFPDGQKRKIWVEWNGCGYTAMFPDER